MASSRLLKLQLVEPDLVHLLELSSPPSLPALCTFRMDECINVKVWCILQIFLDIFHSYVFCNILIGLFYTDFAFNLKRNKSDCPVVAASLLAIYCDFLKFYLIKSHKLYLHPYFIGKSKKSMQTNVFFEWNRISSSILMRCFAAWVSSQNDGQRDITWNRSAGLSWWNYCKLNRSWLCMCT